MKIRVGARGSLLSRKQVAEVMESLGEEGEYTFVETWGDRDLKASLAPMEKTDFFTKEIDEMVLSGRVDVGIHSAKDLPDPLPKGLEIIALTKGLNPIDSLVLREGETLESLPKGSLIGSSSHRRDQIVRALRPDFICKEIRGPVDRRLEALDRQEVEGIVVAEAALLRLGFEKRWRIPLPGKPAPFQGQLAIVAREGERELAERFKPLDSRQKKRILNLGSHPKEGMAHLPLIEIVPRDFWGQEIKRAMADFSSYTHLILTSPNGARLFKECMDAYGVEPKGKKVFAVGKGTAQALEARGIEVDQVAVEERQEGIIDLLALEELENAYLLLPQSSRARSMLSSALIMREIRHQKIALYDTKSNIPERVPDLSQFDEILFTSPSTVEAFSSLYQAIPKDLILRPMGHTTHLALIGSGWGQKRF